MKKSTQHNVVLLVFNKGPFLHFREDLGIAMNMEHLQYSCLCKSWATHTQFCVSRGKNQPLFSIIPRPQCHGNPLCGLPWDLRKQGCANTPFLSSCSAGEGYNRNEQWAPSTAWFLILLYRNTQSFHLSQSRHWALPHNTGWSHTSHCTLTECVWRAGFGSCFGIRQK